MVDRKATLELRQKIQVQRDKLSVDTPLFNRGGSLKEVFASARVETGLDPPVLPSSRTLRGPITRLPHVMALHTRRAKEDALMFQ